MSLSSSTRYWRAKPCKRGHHERWVATDRCIQCDYRRKRKQWLKAKIAQLQATLEAMEKSPLR